MDKNNSYLLFSVNKALKILDLLSIRNELTLTEISEASHTNKTTVFKMLYTLEHRDYVIRTADNKYKLGLKFSNYGNIVSQRTTIAETIKPYCIQLSNTIKETVASSVLNVNGKIILTNLIEGTSPDHVFSHMGVELDSYCTSNGKILLANLPPQVQIELINNIKIIARTPYTVTTKDELKKQLFSLRGQPYAQSIKEYYLDYGDIACPIYDSDRKCVAALSIVCSPEKLVQNRDYYLHLLLESANQISKKLGYYTKSLF